MLVMSFPTLCFAQTTTTGVRFVLPRDIYANSDGLYVLDNINEQKTAIHNFNQNKVKTTYMLNGKFNRLFILDNIVYLLSANNFVWGELKDGKFNKIGEYLSQQTVIDADFFVYIHNSIPHLLFLTVEGMFRINTADKDDYQSQEKSQALSITKVGDIIYILTDNQLFEYKVNNANNVINALPKETKNLANYQTVASGFTTLSGYYIGADHNYCMYNGKSLYYVDALTNTLINVFGKDDITKEQNFPLQASGEITYTQLAVYAKQNKTYYYALTNDKKIERFVVDDNSVMPMAIAKDEFGLGSDYIVASLPQKGSYGVGDIVFVTSCEYPSDYMYRFKDGENVAEQSIPESIDLNAEKPYAIITYDGYENSNFYCCLYQGKFGFVEKAVGKKVEDDSNIHILSVFASAKGKANITTAVYSLPFIDKQEEFKFDTISRYTEFAITKQIEIFGHKWYLIGYTNSQNINTLGWIRQDNVSDYEAVASKTAIGERRINPPVASKVNVYLDINKNPLLIDGNQVSLSVGQRVLLVEAGEKLSVIQFTVGDKLYFGYVDNEYIIDKGVTNTAILGFALLIVAVLVTTFLIIMIKRRPKNQKDIDDLSKPDETLTQTDKD